MNDLRKAAEMALEALEHVDRFDLNRRFCFDEEIDDLRTALAQNPLDIADRAYFAGKQAGIQETLAQGEQETVAWMFEEYAESSKGHMRWFKCMGTQKPQGISEIYRNITPLFTAPVSKQEPVAWVKEGKERVGFGRIEERKYVQFDQTLPVGTKLYTAPPVSDYHEGWEEGFNAGKALAQPEQEPVCDKDPQGCWSIRCQLGKVCKNTAPPSKPQEIDVGIDVTELGTHLVVRRGNEIIKSEFYHAPKCEWVSLTDEEIGLLSTNNTFSGMHPDYLRECFRAIEAALRSKNNG